MTDLIALAKQAGLMPYAIAKNHAQLQAFADLITAREREQCAVLCDELAELNRTSPTNSMWQWAECAAAIRARTTT